MLQDATFVYEAKKLEEELGIPRIQSHRRQTIADMPEEVSHDVILKTVPLNPLLTL